MKLRANGRNIMLRNGSLVVCKNTRCIWFGVFIILLIFIKKKFRKKNLFRK